LLTSLADSRFKSHGGEYGTGFVITNAVGPHSLSGRSCSVASGLSRSIARAPLGSTSTFPSQVARQETCRVRRTFCRPCPTSAKVSTLCVTTLPQCRHSAVRSLPKRDWAARGATNCAHSKAVQWPPPGLVISKAVGYRVKRKRMQRLMRQVGLAAQN